MEIYNCEKEQVKIYHEPEVISIKKENTNTYLQNTELIIDNKNYNMIDYTKYFIELHYENFIFENGYINFAVFNNIEDIERYIYDTLLTDKQIDKIIYTSEINFNNNDGVYIGNIPHIIDYKVIDNKKIAICSLIGYCYSKNENLKNLVKYQNEMKNLIKDQKKVLNSESIKELKTLAKCSIFDFLTKREINYILKYNFDYYTTKEITNVYEDLIIEYQKKYNFEENNLEKYLILSTNQTKSEYYGRFKGLKINFNNLEMIKEFYSIYNFDDIITLNMYDKGYEYKIDENDLDEIKTSFKNINIIKKTIVV